VIRPLWSADFKSRGYSSTLSTRIALAEKFVVFAKGNIALAEKFFAFDKSHVALAEKFVAFAKGNIALAKKLIAFANCKVALAEKFVAFAKRNLVLAAKLVAFANCNVALAETILDLGTKSRYPRDTKQQEPPYVAQPFLEAIDCKQCVILPAKRRSVYGTGGLSASYADGADFSFVRNGCIHVISLNPGQASLGPPNMPHHGLFDYDVTIGDSQLTPRVGLKATPLLFAYLCPSQLLPPDRLSRAIASCRSTA
jgi:hypothetical protein